MQTPSRGKLLLVEDDSIIALAGAARLRGFGFEVVTADTGEEAVRVASADESILLVLMDIDLGPGIDGPEAARLILAGRDLPIVFLTSHSEKSFVDRVREITRYGYVLKDSNNFVLLTSIEMALELFSAHRSALEREARLERAEKVAGFGSWEFDLKTRAVFASRGARRIYGLGDGDWDIPMVQKIPLPGYRAALDAALGALIREGAEYDLEFQIKRPSDGSLAWIHSVAQYDRDRDAVTGVIQDITEKREALRALRRKAGHYEAMLRATSDGFCLLDEEGRIDDVNEAFCRMTGCARSELAGLKFADFQYGGDAGGTEARFRSILESGFERFESRYREKEGRVFDAEVSATHWAEARSIAVFVRDISERKRNDKDRDALLGLLVLMNGRGGLRDLLRGVASLMREWSGCEAAGIRLANGPDFPYYETRGFPEEFVVSESGLCERDGAGKPVPDSLGKPILECMCGNVIRGRFDPALPFFTANGSFWTNSTTRLLASSTESDRKARTRNRCNGEGYESVALVPLRHRGEALGLLQFNDSRPDRFAAEDIALFERAAGYLAIGIAEQLAEEGRAGDGGGLRGGSEGEGGIAK